MSLTAAPTTISSSSSAGDQWKDALKNARALIRIVSRAFYTDIYIVVIDLLLREPMVLAEQLAPRLRLPMKSLEGVIRDLVDQMMIKSERIRNPDTNDTFQYYYIDYQICVLAIFYRIYRMKDRLNKEVKEQVQDVFYLCPSCEQRYSVFDVQGLLSKDMQFVCSSCCPDDDYHDCDTRDHPNNASFRLKEVDNTHVEASLQRSKEHLEVLLKEGGIMELLYKLRDKVLPRNLPSENLKQGQFTSKVKDVDVEVDLKEEMNNMASGRTGGHSSINNRKKAGTTHHILDEQGRVIGIQAASASERLQMAEELQRKQAIAEKQSSSGRSSGGVSAAELFQRQEITKQIMANRDTAVPEFLEVSGVYGASESMLQASSFQRERQENAKRLALQQQPLSASMPLAAVGVGMAMGQEIERVNVDFVFGEPRHPDEEDAHDAKRRKVGEITATASQVRREESNDVNAENIDWEE